MDPVLIPSRVSDGSCARPRRAIGAVPRPLGIVVLALSLWLVGCQSKLPRIRDTNREAAPLQAMPNMPYENGYHQSGGAENTNLMGVPSSLLRDAEAPRLRDRFRVVVSYSSDQWPARFILTINGHEAPLTSNGASTDVSQWFQPGSNVVHLYCHQPSWAPAGYGGPGAIFSLERYRHRRWRKVFEHDDVTTSQPVGRRVDRPVTFTVVAR